MQPHEDLIIGVGRRDGGYLAMYTVDHDEILERADCFIETHLKMQAESPDCRPGDIAFTILNAALDRPEDLGLDLDLDAAEIDDMAIEAAIYFIGMSGDVNAFFGATMVVVGDGRVDCWPMDVAEILKQPGTMH